MQIVTRPTGQGRTGEWAIRLLVFPMQVRLRHGQGWQNKLKAW